MCCWASPSGSGWSPWRRSARRRRCWRRRPCCDPRWSSSATSPSTARCATASRPAPRSSSASRAWWRRPPAPTWCSTPWSASPGSRSPWPHSRRASVWRWPTRSRSSPARRWCKRRGAPRGPRSCPWTPSTAPCISAWPRSTGRRRCARLLLTASGGPFRGRTTAELGAVTVADALAHPTWSMGPKITIDSSTLMNKGLEVIEAHELFGIPVRPHRHRGAPAVDRALDGGVARRLDAGPTLRARHAAPIGYALGWPDRSSVPFGALDWTSPTTLTFEPPDRAVFRCIDLAYQRRDQRRIRAGLAERGQRDRGRGVSGRCDDLERHRRRRGRDARRLAGRAH